jgi:hypothetical protein
VKLLALSPDGETCIADAPSGVEVWDLSRETRPPERVAEEVGRLRE